MTVHDLGPGLARAVGEGYALPGALAVVGAALVSAPRGIPAAGRRLRAARERLPRLTRRVVRAVDAALVELAG